jgi:phosphatidylglycerol---prolipoprotein diacylglyceryl transferase
MRPAVIAVIELDFDPTLGLGDVGVRWETLALAAVIFLALALAAVIAGRTPLDPARPAAALAVTGRAEPNHLRRDDLLFIAVGAIPAAVLGARLGHVLVNFDFYANNPGAILDSAQGSLQLSLGVVGGILGGAAVAVLLGAPLGRWLHAITVPLLAVLALGKLTSVLGGDGQGLPADLPWATAYLGWGPWGSLAPSIPSHPAAAYEALVTGVILIAVVAMDRRGWFRALDGRAFLVALALWAGGRVLVAAVWRDPVVNGPFRADQLLSLAIIAGALLALGGMAAVRERRRRGGPGVTRLPEWSDAEAPRP